MAFGWRCKPRNSHRFGICNVGKPEQIFFFLDKFSTYVKNTSKYVHTWSDQTYVYIRVLIRVCVTYVTPMTIYDRKSLSAALSSCSQLLSGIALRNRSQFSQPLSAESAPEPKTALRRSQLGAPPSECTLWLALPPGRRPEPIPRIRRL